MKLPKLKIKGKLITGLTALIVFSVGVMTQEVQRTFTVINPTIQQTIKPGGIAEGTTAVINDTNAPLTFNLSVQDYIVSDTIGTPNLLPNT